jgi:hypothetical protein
MHLIDPLRKETYFCGAYRGGAAEQASADVCPRCTAVQYLREAEHMIRNESNADDIITHLAITVSYIDKHL